MSDKINLFDHTKLTIHEYQMVKSHVDNPVDFDQNKVAGYQLNNSLQLGFNLEEKLIKADFSIDISSQSNGKNQKESSGSFHFTFIYSVLNLSELSKVHKGNLIELDPLLGDAIASVTYSTVRGILMTRLQGTALQYFVLPIINPNSLLH